MLYSLTTERGVVLTVLLVFTESGTISRESHIFCPTPRITPVRVLHTFHCLANWPETDIKDQAKMRSNHRLCRSNLLL